MRSASWRNSFSITDISPKFILILAAFAIGGLAAYWVPTGIAVFLLVVTGWVLSVCLHEFGHALAAYLGGDYTVADKGYLTLDPTKYTHPLLSIVFPVLMVIMGGIGLPGGAVYIDTYRLRGRQWQSLVSAAGPLATLACFVVLWIPFSFGLHRGGGHAEFWAGLALLAYIELGAFFINLLPLPGIDGFGILEPWLPYSILSRAYAIRPYGFIILYLLFVYVPLFSRTFFTVVTWVAGLSSIDLSLVSTGFGLFRFWNL